jgi:uncharacterized repeat protein (TIGR01451 family)
VIFVTGDVSPTIDGLHITGGDAFWLGGGLWDEDTGGGVYVHHSSGTLSNNTLFNNVAYSGGGVYLRGSAATLRDNRISGNQSIGTGPGTPGGGGGVYLMSSPATLEGNLVTANSALRRGGGAWLFASHNTKLSDNTFLNNTANWGGALFMDSSNSSIEGNAVISNSATYGGGLYLEGSDAHLDRNIIQTNSASVGGGLFMYRCSPTLINTIVAANPADVGSNLYVVGSVPRLLHTTIAGGQGAGTGVWVEAAGGSGYPSTVRLTNTILVSHTVGITVAGGNTATLSATLWGTATWANQTDWGGAGTISTGSVNVWDDPAFVNPGEGDYRLGLGSAATDAGLDADIGHDLDGEGRPIGPEPDIGADEAGVLVGKGAAPLRVLPGALLTYTLRVTNVSNIDLQATITDVLPPGVTTTSPLMWTPLITAPGGIWEQTLAVTVEQDHLGSLVNEIQVTSDEGAAGAARVTALAVLRVYLPLLMR